MFGKRETHFVVLNDLDDGREAVRRALQDAPEAERPGLERALAVLDSVTGSEAPQVRWTREVLAEAGIDPVEREVAAVREVRKRMPGLSLVAAVELVRSLNPGVRARGK
ncbi:hypothetical protein GCM10023108_49980 [Saccharopolyspora hordei]